MSTTGDEDIVELAQRPVKSPRLSRYERFDKWPHDHQPGYSQYSDDSDASRVPCSLESSMESVEMPVKIVKLSKAEKEAQMEQITKYLEERQLTVLKHKMSDNREMLLAFKIYD
jgi:hypothetical protein